MTLKELKSILKRLNIPIAYNHFNSKKEPPYVIYMEEGTTNFFADDVVYTKIRNVNLELYTKNKDVELENKLEKILMDNEIAYEIVGDSFIQSESLHEIIYSISI